MILGTKTRRDRRRQQDKAREARLARREPLHRDMMRLLPVETLDNESLAVEPDVAEMSHDVSYVGYQANGVQLVSSSTDGVNWTAAVQVSDAGNHGIDAQLAVDTHQQHLS